MKTNTEAHELIERFWATHESHSLSKDKWTLEDSVNALLPMVIKDVQEATRRELSDAVMDECATFPDGGAGPSHELAIRIEARLAALNNQTHDQNH